jgi:hypothetical protein
MNRDVIKAFMDGAYDTRGSYTILRGMGISLELTLGRIGVLQRGEHQQLYSRCLVKKDGVGSWATVEDGL